MSWFRPRKKADVTEQQRIEALNALVSEVSEELARTGGPADGSVVVLRAQTIDGVLRLTQVDCIVYTSGAAPEPRVFCRTVLAPAADRMFAISGSSAPFSAALAAITVNSLTRQFSTVFAWDAEVTEHAIDEHNWLERAVALNPLGESVPATVPPEDGRAPYPWAGRYLDRLDHQLRADLTSKAAGFATMYVFVSSSAGEIGGQVVTADASGNVHMSMGHLDHATLDLAVDALAEDTWSAGNQDVTAIITCDATTGEIVRRVYVGEDATRYQVTPMNAEDIVNELRGA